MNTTELSDMTDENHNRRHADEVSLRQTQEMPVTPERLDAVYPEVRCRPEHDCSNPAECICDAIHAADIKGSLATTLRDVPAIDEAKPAPIMMSCPECEGTGNVAPPPLSGDPQDALYSECYECEGFGEVKSECSTCWENVEVELVEGRPMCEECAEDFYRKDREARKLAYEEDRRDGSRGERME